MAVGDQRQPTRLTELPVAAALPAMQALASRTWTREARHHPGQLAWSYAYGEPVALGHGPVALVHRGDDPDDPGDPGDLDDLVAWAWAESDDWLELCVDPAAPDADAAADTVIAWFRERAGGAIVRTSVLETERLVLAALDRAGFEVDDLPWFTHHFLELADLPPVPGAPGYTFRPVEPEEAEDRSACHRATWSPPGGTSLVTAAAYARLMRTPPYRTTTDWVALDADGTMVASAIVWLDDLTGVALVEPVGCVPDHRGHGLAGAVSLAALHAARDLGGTLGLVCPRGDEGYPVPMRVYQRIGFVPGPRTLTLVAG